MKEKDNEENEKEINNINNNEDNNIFSFNQKKPEDENEEERNDLNLFDEDELILEDIKVGTKIRCPIENCFENCIVMIEPNFFQVSFDCGEHHDKLDIIKYIKKSGISKDDKEKCFECQLTYEKIKQDEDNKILYKCYCGKNICKKCKKTHLDENLKNKNDHNMIDFKYKDYKCCCSNKGKKYNSFCLTCEKNLCQLCNENHKDHESKNFGELVNINEEKKNMLIQKIKNQKKEIDKFNEIIDDWFKNVKKIIDKYKKKLELYYQINLIIINRYNSNTNYYEEIKNIDYLRIDFDENFNNLIKSENDFFKRNSIIYNLLNDIIDKKKNVPVIDVENKFKNIKIKESIELNGCVNHLCEIKKDGTLIVGINNINNNKDELHFFRQIEDLNKLKKYVRQFSKEEDIKILNLKELKNGYLLVINEKQFEIRDVKTTPNYLKTIQQIKREDNDERFINIIELINGFLISISYSISDKYKNYIIFWKQNIMKGKYELCKTIEKRERPIEILEINKEKFLVLFENNYLYCYNSNINKINETKLIKIENQFPLKKMIKVKEDGILFVNEKYFILFSLTSLQVKNIPIEHNITDICYISNSNNFFLESFSEENNQEFLLLNIDLIKYEINKFKCTKKKGTKIHNLRINCIYQLNNGNIITGSEDKKINIWEYTI